MYNSPSQFESGASLTAVTGTLQQGSISFEGRQFSIVDSPGFFDTKKDSTPESTVKTDGENMSKLVRAIENSKQNIFEFVFVFDEGFSTLHKVW